MHFDPLDVEGEVKWTLRPRNYKRKCEYLDDKATRQLYLPSPRDDVMLQSTENQRIKKTCLAVNRNRVWDFFGGIHMPRIRVSISPAAIIGAIHILLNLFVVTVFIFCLGYILLCAVRDISYKISVKRAETKLLIEEARRLFILNRCDPTTRVPALQQQCDKWDHMSKNGFHSIKYTKIVVEMFADVLDGFVSKFKFKTVTVLVIFMSVYLILRKRSI